MGPLDREREFIKRNLSLARAALQPARDVLEICDKAAAEEKRLGAVDRIARRFPRPIHLRRWPQVAPALSMDGEQAGRGLEQELLVRLQSALLIVVPEIVDPRTLGEEGLSLDEVWERFRKELNRQITEDLLGGTEGRRAWESNVPLQNAPERPDEPSEERIRDEKTLMALAAQAGFSNREFQLVLALAGGTTFGEFAESRGIKDGTVRVMAHRIHKKLSRL